MMFFIAIILTPLTPVGTYILLRLRPVSVIFVQFGSPTALLVLIQLTQQAGSVSLLSAEKNVLNYLKILNFVGYFRVKNLFKCQIFNALSGVLFKKMKILIFLSQNIKRYQIFFKGRVHWSSFAP